MRKIARLAVIALFGLSLSLSISATLILAAVLLIEWGVRSLSKNQRRAWQLSSLDIPIFIFYIWMVVTAFYRHTADPWDAISSPSAFLLFYWAAHDLEGDDLTVLFRWFCIGASAAGLLGALQYVGKINYLPDEKIYFVPPFFSKWPLVIVHRLALHNGRAMGPRSHPLTYAECFIPAFFILLGWILKLKREQSLRLSNFWVFVGGGLILGGVLLAEGRAVWLGLAVGLMVFNLTMGRQFFLRAMLVLGMVMIPLFIFGSAKIRGRLMSIVSSTSGSLADQQSKSIRFELWRSAVEQIKKDPLTGVGYKEARLVTLDPVSGQERIWTETHNMFLQNALELGVIGLGLFIWVLFLVGKIFWDSPGVWRPVLLAAFAAFLIAGLTESWPRDKEVAMLFWLMAGCAETLRGHAPLR